MVTVSGMRRREGGEESPGREEGDSGEAFNVRTSVAAAESGPVL